MASPIAEIADDSPLVGTLDTAGSRALSNLRDRGASAEEAGVILQDPTGKYSFTHPIRAADDSFSIRAHINSGWKLAGLYHSHPGEQDSVQYFSPQDVAVANHLKVPSYILFQKDGSIRKYTPGVTPTTIMKTAGGMMPVAKGDQLKLPKEGAQTFGAGDWATASSDKQEQYAGNINNNASDYAATDAADSTLDGGNGRSQ